MVKPATIFTTVRTEGALLPPDVLQRITEGANIDGLSPDSYHYPGEKLNEVINRAWNVLQGRWASFREAQAKLPEGDRGTTITRERWLLPLFRELDYGRLETAPAHEIDGRSYPISHQWRQVPIHLVSYQIELDQRTAGVAGAATASPHSLLQIFLNRSDEHLWGFVSNGYKLRILRDNLTLTRQAYVEFDLEAMMEGEVYSDFVLLWLLCHQSRVEADRPTDFWLEKWMKVAEEQGTRALDQLRNGVEQAITALGLGFIEHPANGDLRDKLTDGHLSGQDYYRQLLRIVYRLLFLFVAEDRDLLRDPNADPAAQACYQQYYSTARLRRLAQRFNGTRHHDLFEGLRLVMRLLAGPHPKSFSQVEKDLLRRGTKDAAYYQNIAAQAMVKISRELRQRQTPAEHIVWEALRDRRLNDLKFRRQHPIANTSYVVDFLCYEASLVIEIDGGIHEQQQQADAQRQAQIEALGYRVIRFSNDDVQNDLEWVLATIAHAAKHPLLPRREGGRGDEGSTAGRRDEGNPQPHKALGLVPLGSFLFSDRAVADVIDCQINNQHLLDAVRALALIYDDKAGVYRSIDYKNLGSEELGSVYESLLELHPQINIGARRFALATAGGNERKTTGSYYTPTSLINALLDSALDPVLARAKRGTSPHPKSLSQGARDLQQPPSPLGRRAGDEGKTPLVAGGDGSTAEERILALKVCDPACGSGHFLIAAANRMAKALAEVRTGEEEPAPPAIQAAKRDIIGHCLYGVDINPMAVELCKVNLWMEALEPGKPLSFLDHRIQVGNSLLGTTPKLMAGGIPDKAFQPIEGDDRSTVSELKKANKREHGGQQGLFDVPKINSAKDGAELATQVRELDAIPDDTLAGIRARERRYANLLTSPAHYRQKLLSDAWCSAFVWVKKPLKTTDTPPLTQRIYMALEGEVPFNGRENVELEVARLAEQYQFFHWHIAFPDVFGVPDDVAAADNPITGWDGGFDVVLGNPPWERIKIQEKEWFAERAPDIAAAPNAAARRKLIAELEANDPYLLAAFAADKRKAEGESHFIRESGRYPLTGRGDVNTYAVFTGLSRSLISITGYLGLVIPTGIATDVTYQHFFEDVVQKNQLVNLFDFENRGHLFSDLHTKTKFSIFTLSRQRIIEATFCFLATDVNDLKDNEKVFRLSPQDFFLFNPNTKTTPLFRNRRDVEITRAMYSKLPILINEDELSNPWTLDRIPSFHMANDSGLFLVDPLPQTLPLYEAKMFYHFEHRWATFNGQNSDLVSSDEKVKSDFHVRPRYWISADEVKARTDKKWDRQWFVGYRAITDSRNERTVIFSILPNSGAGHSITLVIFSSCTPWQIICFISNMNALTCDYITRQKIAGTNLSSFIVEQIPVIPPHTYTPDLLDFIVPRVLELTYTAWDLQAFAADVGYDGPPFVWDEERRFLMRCELDALYFHLYQISRDDVDYILETFPIVKRKDIAATADGSHPLSAWERGPGGEGEYLTKRIILEMYDQMAALPTMDVPHPKSFSQGEKDLQHPSTLGRGAGGEGDAPYPVPDIRHWETWLSPPPADPAAAHEEKN